MKISGLLLLISVALLAGCGGVKAPMGLDNAEKLKEAKKMSDTLVYQNPDIDALRYKRFILEKVVIYEGEDNEFGNIDKEDRTMMADFIRDEFIRAFEGSKFPIVNSPGPDVLRIKFTLLGLTRSVPVAQGLNYLMFPIGSSMQIAKGVLGKSGTFMGNAVLAVEFNDSRTDDVVAALVTKQTANALNFKAAFSGKYGAAKSGITELMEIMRKSADVNHGYAAR